MDRIYVSIASLYDKELSRTVKDAMTKADAPDRVFLGVAVAGRNKEVYNEVAKIKKSYKNNIRLSFTKITRKNHREVFGVGRGRLRAASMYANEEYFLQVDSHTSFSQGWDTDLIGLLKEAKQEIKSEKVVLTTYAGKYYLDHNGDRLFKEDDNVPGTHKRFGFLYNTFIDKVCRFDVVPAWGVINSENARKSDRRFIPSFKFSANFAFGDSEFANNLSITENEIFFEEEILQGMRLLGLGYSLVYPNVEESIIKHLYGDYGTNESFFDDYKRENLSTSFRSIGYGEEKDIAVKNYLGFMFDKTNRELIESYQRYAGIDLMIAKSTLHDSFPQSWKLDIIKEG